MYEIICPETSLKCYSCPVDCCYRCMLSAIEMLVLTWIQIWISWT